MFDNIIDDLYVFVRLITYFYLVSAQKPQGVSQVSALALSFCQNVSLALLNENLENAFLVFCVKA